GDVHRAPEQITIALDHPADVHAAVGLHPEIFSEHPDEAGGRVDAGAGIAEQEHRAVPEQLEDATAALRRDLLGTLLERGGDVDGGLIAPLLGDRGVAGDIDEDDGGGVGGLGRRPQPARSARRSSSSSTGRWDSGAGGATPSSWYAAMRIGSA